MNGSQKELLENFVTNISRVSNLKEETVRGFLLDFAGDMQALREQATAPEKKATTFKEMSIIEKSNALVDCMQILKIVVKDEDKLIRMAYKLCYGD